MRSILGAEFIIPLILETRSSPPMCFYLRVDEY